MPKYPGEEPVTLTAAPDFKALPTQPLKLHVMRSTREHSGLNLVELICQVSVNGGKPTRISVALNDRESEASPAAQERLARAVAALLVRTTVSTEPKPEVRPRRKERT